MSRYALRKAGGSVMVTIPPAFLKKTGLKAGSAVEVNATGDKLVVTPAKVRVTLADILKAAPKDVRKLRAEGWEEMPAAGNEA
ncbi:MAG: AbrB/MazE/SpoVT family DNA-binding domain-containing protein [Solimonas sp.]